MKICSVPGCPKRSTGGKCPDCAPVPDANRPSAAKRGYGAKWRKTSRAYLSANPVCEQGSCLNLASDVDHIDGLGPNGPAGFDWSNLRALCKPHHSQRTARDQPGGWNRR